MASIIKTRRDDHVYLYAATSARVDGAPRIVNQVYLGTEQEVLARLTATAGGEPSLPAEMVHRKIRGRGCGVGMLRALGGSGPLELGGVDAVGLASRPSAQIKAMLGNWAASRLAGLSVPACRLAAVSRSGQSSPHDAVFRRVLGEPVNAASQLRAVLPGALVDRLDLDRLTRVSGSFVDAALRWRHSDLLFTVPLQDRAVLVYVLVEHQSSEDPLMPFRMLRYVVRIWDRYLSDHSEATRLPAVIPLVVHHNRRPWSGSTQVLDLLDLDPQVIDAVREYLPGFRFILDDLTRLDERALRARPLTAPARITLLLLKIAAGNTRLADDLQGWADDLRAILDRPGGVEQFVALVSYIALVGEAPTDQLHTLIATLGPEAQEAYMTTAEMLRAEGEAHGRAEGRAEGEAHGRAEGEAHGRAEALVQLLTLKLGPLPRTALDTVYAASTDQLETWTARVLSADTLDDVLG